MEEQLNTDKFKLSSKRQSQFKLLLMKALRIKIREPLPTFGSFIFPIYIMFILVVLSLALSDRPGDVEIRNLPTLKSLCPVESCIDVGYTSVNDISPLISQLESLIIESEQTASLQSFPTATDMREFRKNNGGSPAVGIDFFNSTLFQVNYSIYVNNSAFTDGYIKTGLVTAQSYVDRAVSNAIRSQSNQPLLRSPLDYKSGLNGITLSSVSGKLSTTVTSFMPYYFVFMLMISLQNVFSRLVVEKQKKIKSSSKVMGLNDFEYLASVCVAEFIFALPMLAIILLLSFAGQLFVTGSLFVLFLLVLLYILGAIFMGAALSAFFNDEKASSPVSFMIVIFPLVAYGICATFVFNNPDRLWAEYVIMLVPHCALARGIDVMARQEETLQGITLENLGSNEIMVRAFIMLIVDVFLYAFLAWNNSHRFPGEFGEPAPWLFFLRPSFYNPQKAAYETSTPLSSTTNIAELPSVEDKAEYIEPADRSALEGPEAFGIIKTEKIRKEFKEGGFWKKADPKVAVDSVNIELHNGQILALLGHNGAGKTTLISMLCGLLSPTCGVARVKLDGVSLSTDKPFSMSRIRQSLGVCPQHDVLIDVLTCREHLQLYSVIKGVKVDSGGTMAEYHEALIKDVSLMEKIDARIMTLSGGQKRKLSLAIALLGDPKIILLDECTTGMDVESTHLVWSFLEKVKKNRVVLLTTHSMEEADVLGDRIAVLSKGQIQALGTSMFLKSRYGAGYQIKFDVTSSHTPSDLELLKKYVSDYFGEGENIQSTASGNMITFAFKSNEYQNKLPTFFSSLSEKIVSAKEFGFIENIGISVTTLEEVFLKLKEEEDRKSEEIKKQMATSS